MRSTNRRTFLGWGSLVVGGALGGWMRQAEADREMASTDGRQVTVKQEPGNLFYWVLPGPRRISEEVFGTPDAPRFGADMLKYRIKQAKQLPDPLSEAIPQLCKDLPILVCLPEQARETNEAGTQYTQTSIATPFSDKGVPTSGQFEVTYADARPHDMPGKPGDTPDSVDFTASFTDPDDNEYEVKLDHVVQPPIPGYETAGGVMIDAWHHGTTGTGTPLMPQVYTYGALWGVGNVLVNGEVADEHKVVHMMTTQNVRDKDYRLAVGKELPLKADETIGGQVHHTHMFVLPVKATEKGPVHDPVKTAFKLTNGKTQPFIHAMWEQDTLVDHPFKDWPKAAPKKKAETAEAITEVRVKGSEWTLDPDAFTARAGTELTVHFENVGDVAHNLTFGKYPADEKSIKKQAEQDLIFAQTPTIQPEKTTTLTVTPERAGTYPYWCDVPGHRQKGMVGRMTVV